MTKTATWFHCSAKPISRSKGRSSVATAAYRLGVCLHNEKQDIVHDYRRKGGVITGFTLAPENAPAWASDPERLWNAVEVKENRKNSQLALEWEVALPHELSHPQREAIARRFSHWLIDTYGVAVSTGIHRDGQRSNGPNDHMHVQMTTRALGADGWAKHKLRNFNCRPGRSNPEIERVRAQAASFINDALQAVDSDERVTHLSYKARGIDRKPTGHLGPSAAEMERREAGSSDIGRRNRDIVAHNETLAGLVDELAELDAEIAELEEQRLDERYGPAGPDDRANPPATPQEAAVASFEASLRPVIDALDTAGEPPATEPLERGWHEPDGEAFDIALHPAVASLGTAGEASAGSARRWKRMLEVYRHGTDRLAALGRDALGSWQRFRRDGLHGRDGPER